MTAKIVVLVAAVVVLQVIPQSEALRCYQCDSSSTQGCEEPFVQSNRIAQIDCRPLNTQFSGGFGGQPGGSFGGGQFNQQGQQGQSGWGQAGQPGQSGWGQSGQAGQPGQSGFGQSTFGNSQGYCRKLTGKMSDGRMYVQRSCMLDTGFQPGGGGGGGGSSSSSSRTDSCISTPDGNGYDCRCYSDLCNGAPSKTKMALLPLLAVAALAVFLGRK